MNRTDDPDRSLSPGRLPPERFERDDSRARDGVLSAEEQARVERERAATPARMRAHARLDEALTLWSDEALARAERSDPQAMAERILETIAADPEGRRLAPALVSWRYAAAAAVLLGLGLGGLALTSPAERTPGRPDLASDVEKESLAVIRRLELERLPVGEGR